jgi:membrane-bound lytic murein transglycosylase B
MTREVFAIMGPMPRFLFAYFFALSLIFPAFSYAQTAQDYEARLRAEEEKLQEEVRALSKDVSRLQGQKATIEQAIALIDAQIKEAQAKIRLRTLTIEGLTKDIKVKTNTVSELEGKLARSKVSLSNLVRRTEQIDSTSLPEILLAKGQMSDFFVQVDAYGTLKDSLNTMMEDVRDYKSQTEGEKAALEERKIRETDARKAIEAEKKIVDLKKAEQAQLLAIKAGELKTYQQYVAEKQTRISQIRSALFDLRGTEGIAFGDAVDYALEASRVTGVRAAFILAILRQESNLGKNVGQCLLVDANTGAGKGKNTGTPFAKTMHPTRDVPIFLDITRELGRDPYNTPVSCPQSIGYGGAMGPTQFIPSTWKTYAKRLASALGVSTADPWLPDHAIMATAIFTKDLGAGKGGYSAEREAAARYYAGGNWRSLGIGYANSVLAYAADYQEQIDFITGN